MYQEIDDCIFLREPEGTVSFCRDDLYRYSGPRSMIASALVFRIMKEAIHDLSPSDIPERKAFMILSGHAGPGVRDGFELLTRAFTEGRYRVDAVGAPKEAPRSAAGGHMFFRIGYKNKAMLYVLSDELFGEKWFRQVQMHQEGSVSAEAHAQYLVYKNDLCGKILYLPSIFSISCPCSPDELIMLAPKVD